ncbi:MAG: CYTH domain-containing protein [Elusimicrobia bacterium]|nr:CYTH domain-containing protein [Elusimicrobiota bacterium]
MSEKIELEAKWLCRSESGFAAFRAEAIRCGAESGRPRPVLIKDSYLDTRDSFFGRRRVSCRLRNAGGRWELTLKARTALKAGVASRLERTIPLRGRRSPAQALARVRAMLSAVPGHESLKEVFVIVNRRTILPLGLADGTGLECAFDRMVIRRGKKAVRMLEIEVEFLEGKRAAFCAFVRAVKGNGSFSPSSKSKVATALAAFSLGTRASGDPAEAFSLCPT